MQICLYHAIFHIENYTNQTCKYTYRMAIMSWGHSATITNVFISVLSLPSLMCLQWGQQLLVSQKGLEGRCFVCSSCPGSGLLCRWLFEIQSLHICWQFSPKDQDTVHLRLQEQQDDTCLTHMSVLLFSSGIIWLLVTQWKRCASRGKWKESLPKMPCLNSQRVDVRMWGCRTQAYLIR